jgi:acetolactate synthase-1/2/3 large subunit
MTPLDSNSYLTGAEYLVKALANKGVKKIFGYPGGAIMPVYDALVDSELDHILCRHEQAASLAADGYARVSGEVGVCLATSGPGATNLITGLANAYMDSVPVLAITGQVATSLIGTDAFQEIDIFGMTLPVVKHSFLVQSAESLPEILTKAIAIAQSGRPGPVLVDIPKDIQVTEFNLISSLHSTELGDVNESKNKTENDAVKVHSIDQYAALMTQVQSLLELSAKPLFYLGGGIGIAKCESLLRQLLHQTSIPAITTLKGIGCYGEYSLGLGMLGMHGHQAANLAVQNCDLLIVIGARFDDRATGNLERFAPNAKVIHFDIDDAEVDKRRFADVSIVGNLTDTLKAFSELFMLNNVNHRQESSERPDWGKWNEWCRQQKKDFQWQYNPPGKGIYAPRLLKYLTETKDEQRVIACDVGQHQMWVAQHCQFSAVNRHLSSGGLGTMGYGLPAAIGAQFAEPGSCVINVCGDGSFAMNLQELITLVRYRLPVKILLIDNQSLGMVRQWQHLFFKDRFSEIDLSDNPDFVQVAQAFGLSSMRITHKHEEQAGIDWLLSEKGPCLLQVCIDNEQNVWPLVPPGADNSEMMVQSDG